MMDALRDLLAELDAEDAALGQFNVSDMVFLKAVLAGAAQLEAPVLIGASEGERRFFGTRELAAVVKSLREDSDRPIFLNADHTHSLASAVEAAKTGFDAVVIDFSALSFEENVRRSREVVEAIKAINPSILAEGEIGNIGIGSHLDVERIAKIKKAGGVFLTLHGASGTDDEDLRAAIAAGINIVHINTELRVAWRQSLEASLAGAPGEVVPYEILSPVVDSVMRIASSRLRLFGAQRAMKSRSAPGNAFREHP